MNWLTLRTFHFFFSFPFSQFIIYFACYFINFPVGCSYEVYDIRNAVVVMTERTCSVASHVETPMKIISSLSNDKPDLLDLVLHHADHEDKQISQRHNKRKRWGTDY